MTWSQTQSTNWAKYVFGNTASYTDVQTSISGGNDNTSFSTSGNFHRETNIISDQSNYLRGGIHLNLNHKSSNKKFELQMTNSITIDGNKSPNLANAYSTITLPPNLPLTTNGQPTLWFGNPAMDLSSTTNVQTNNIISSISLSYVILNNLKFKVSGGYNKININQQLLFPLQSQFGPPNYSQFLQNDNESVTMEPQLNYTAKVGNGDLNVLAGGTYEYRTTTGHFFQISDFSNEELMDDFSSGASVDIRNNLYSQYRYVSLFGRVNYNLLNKYIFNLTFRRDGSSRFGPGNQYGNFGSAGAAWLFGEEKWVKNTLPFLSFGKLRTSYGSTGNDQIPDYNYLSTYTSSGRTIQDVGLLAPSRIANANFHLETTKKLEFGLELGILKNRVLLDADYYENRSSDQLVNYTLPAITGFSSYVANLPAVVQNTGWEFDLATINLKNSKLSWTTSFNLTIPRNKLVNFQNFSTSAYSQLYQIGYDITRVHGYQFVGVNPQTGNTIYGDINGNPAQTASAINSNYTIGKTTPNFYGGFSNTVAYKQFSLDIFLQFTSQMAQGGILYSPGQEVNSYAYVVNSWREPGMITNVPKASTIGDYNYPNSSANFFNSSYLRVKNVAISYNLPDEFAKKMNASRVTVFLKAQNLLTFWNKNIPLMDPEAGALTDSKYAIAPTKSLVAGLGFTF